MITKVPLSPQPERNPVVRNQFLGKQGYQLPELDVPAVDAAEALGAGNVGAGD